jgi:cytochrome c-type biogenesis protein CcmH
MDYLVQRFGEFILLRPRFEWQTLLLWIAPFATLALGAIGAFVAMRRRRAHSGAEEEQRLTDAELAELKQLE